jgi:hypothetical protein
MMELVTGSEQSWRRFAWAAPLVRRGNLLSPDQLAMLHAAPLLPDDETERLADLRDLSVLDTQADAELDTLVELAAATCGTPMAALSFVDGARQRYKSRVGIPVEGVSRNAGLCSRAILAPEPVLEVPDTARLPWFMSGLHGPTACRCASTPARRCARAKAARSARCA